MSRLLTASRAKDARACRRKHHIKYDLGLRPATEEAHALRFGTLMHRGLEAWWLAVQAKRPQSEWLDEAIRATTESEVDAVDLAKVQVLLTGYHLRWAEDAAECEVLAVEARFEGPLVNPMTGRQSQTWRLAGKIDVLIRTGTLTLIVEHKTSSEDITPGSDYWRRLRMDGQVSTYFEGARLLGHQVDACLYDVIAKPRHRPSEAKSRKAPETIEEFRARLAEAVAEEPSKYFARGEVVRLESEMAEHLADTWALGQQLREEELAGRFPRNPDACLMYGRPCPYFAACSGEASLDDERLFAKVPDVHPELTEAVSDRPSL